MWSTLPHKYPPEMRAALAELGVAQGGEVFALAPPYLSSPGRVGALARVIAASERSVRKCLFLFLAVKLLPPPTGAVSVQCLLLPGTERPLGGRTLSAPVISGSRSRCTAWA